MAAKQRSSPVKEQVVAELVAKRLRGESIEKIADEIEMFSNAAKKLMGTRLTDEAIYLLLQQAIGKSAATNYREVPIKIIKITLEHACALSDTYLKAKEKK